MSPPGSHPWGAIRRGQSGVSAGTCRFRARSLRHNSELARGGDGLPSGGPIAPTCRNKAARWGARTSFLMRFAVACSRREVSARSGKRPRPPARPGRPPRASPNARPATATVCSSAALFWPPNRANASPSDHSELSARVQWKCQLVAHYLGVLLPPAGGGSHHRQPASPSIWWRSSHRAGRRGEFGSPGGWVVFPRARGRGLGPAGPGLEGGRLADGTVGPVNETGIAAEYRGVPDAPVITLTGKPGPSNDGEAQAGTCPPIVSMLRAAP